MTHRHAIHASPSVAQIMKHVPILKVPKFENIYDKLNFNYSILNTSFCIIILSVSKGGFYLSKITNGIRETKEFITVNSNCEEVREDDKERLRKNYDDAYKQIQDWYRGLYDELLKGAGC